MPTLKDLVVEYEKEFVQRLKRYSKEDFLEFIDDHVEKCRKLLEGEKDDEMILVDDAEDKSEKEVREARKRFYDGIIKHEGEYQNWREAFADIFQSREGYWESIEPIINAEQEITKSYKGFKDHVDKHGRFVNSSIKRRKEMGYLCFPLEPLTERYTITLNICTLTKDGGYKVRATEELNEHLKNPELTIFGRDAPESSRLHKYKLEDASVSRKQGCLGLNKDGYLVLKNLGKNPYVIEDYERNRWEIKQGEIKRLVPSFFDKDQGSASVYFGGKDKNYFKLEIVLELKIKEGILKTAISALPHKT